MKNPADTIAYDIAAPLNLALAHALAGINQYFLHARILKHNGYMSLADYEYKESIAEMKHADRLVERILALGGLPEMQQVEVTTGQTVPAILDADMKLSEAQRRHVLLAIAVCKQQDDIASVALLEKLLSSADERIAAALQRLNQIDRMGLEGYLQSQA